MASAWAGIDFDTRAVHVVLRPEVGPAGYYGFELGHGVALERVRRVREAMPSRGWWDEMGVLGAGLEEPFGYGGSAAKLMRVQGAILACLPTGLPVQLIAPGKWRALVGLSPRASKADVAEYVQHTEWSQDAKDAYCLALAAEALMA